MVKSKLNKKNSEEKLPKIDINLLEKIRKNGTIFIKKDGASSRTPSPSPASKSVESSGKAEAGKKESAIPQSNKTETKVSKSKTPTIERNGSLEEHVDFSAGFEPTKEASPVIQERKERREEPVKDMEQFLETVPKPKKEEGVVIYEPIDENYLRSYETTYQGQKWDEERVVHEIKENLVKFENPGRFRETMAIQDPAISHERFSEQVKYDLERVDRIENEGSIFRPVFEKKYKSRGKL